MEALDKQFGITEAGSSVEAEIRAGFTTFLTMAYILVVNPSMLSNFGATGIPFGDVLFATAIAAFVGSTIMGLWANLPFALAPGMGLNAYFTFGVVLGMGIPWDVALAAVFCTGNSIHDNVITSGRSKDQNDQLNPNRSEDCYRLRNWNVPSNHWS